MDKQELEQLVEHLIDERLEELEIEQFAEDTANLLVELKHEIEDLKNKV